MGYAFSRRKIADVDRNWQNWLSWETLRQSGDNLDFQGDLGSKGHHFGLARVIWALLDSFGVCGFQCRSMKVSSESLGVIGVHMGLIGAIGAQWGLVKFSGTDVIGHHWGSIEIITAQWYTVGLIGAHCGSLCNLCTP